MKQKYLKLPKRPAIPVPDLSKVKRLDLNSWTKRIYLASMHWRTRLEFTIDLQRNRLDLTLRADNGNWYGTLSEVSLSRHVTLDEKDLAEIGSKTWRTGYDDQWAGEDDIQEKVTLVVNRLDKLTDELCDLAIEAMTYTDCVPMFHQGKFIVHEKETEYFNTYPTSRVVHPERAFATNALPGWPKWGDPLPFFLDELKDTASINNMVLSFFRLSELGYDVTDHLNPWSEGGWDHLDLEWQYELKSYPRHALEDYFRKEERTSPYGDKYRRHSKPAKDVTRDLSAVSVSLLADRAANLYNHYDRADRVPLFLLNLRNKYPNSIDLENMKAEKNSAPSAPEA